MTIRKHSQLSNVPYQVFRHVEGAPVMLRRGRKRGSFELWRLHHAARNGNLISTDDSTWLRLQDAHEDTRLLNEIGHFYGAAFASAMARVVLPAK